MAMCGFRLCVVLGPASRVKVFSVVTVRVHSSALVTLILCGLWNLLHAHITLSKRTGARANSSPAF